MATVALRRTYTPPIRVDFRHNAWDREIQLLAKEGFYAPAIQAKIPALTVGQVRYRLRACGFGADYRRGKSDDAKEVMDRVSRLIRKARHLRKELWQARKGDG